MAVPEGGEGKVRARPGVAWKKGPGIINAPGTIDSDYRGEVKILAINLGQETIEIPRGERVAQLGVAPVFQARIEVSASLDESERGSGGFGSTGRD